MNKVNLTIKTLLLMCSMSLLFASCKKDDIEELGDAGQTIVKIPSDDGVNLIAMDLVSTAQNINLLEIRRDVHSEASLNSTLTVKVVEDPQGVADYNAAHNTNYTVLPTTAYTIDPSNPKVGNEYTVTFAPGEFVKYIKVQVPDATVLNPNSKYATFFTISSVEGNGKASADLDASLVEVGVKNRWDGVYKVTGTMVDLTNATLTGYYPLTFELRTTGANTVAVFDKSQGTQTHLILSGTSLSQYGSYGLNLTFDPATNKITSITNSYGQLSGGFQRSAALDPTGVNAYDPVTKTIKIKYLLQQGAGFTTRTIFDETWVYTGPR